MANFDGVTLAEVRSRLEKSDLPKLTMTPEIGGGYHAYWRLRKPRTKNKLYRLIQKGGIAALDSDRSVRDSPRVMRMPGTRNTKPQRNNALVRIIEIHPKRKHRAGSFRYQREAL